MGRDRPEYDFWLPPHVSDAPALAASLAAAVVIWRRELQVWVEPWIAAHETVAGLLEGVAPEDEAALRRIQEVCAARAEWAHPHLWVCEHDAWMSLMHVVRRVADRVDRRLTTPAAPRAVRR